MRPPGEDNPTIASARDTLVAELREHALVIGRVTLTSGRTTEYYVDAKRAILRPAGFRALGELVAEAARELGEYFAGHRTAFELPLDLRLAHGFRRTVLDHLRRVDYGSTTTYAALAAQAGSPRAVRATGSACATNPLPLVVPCHRVLRSDGTVGQYAGGAEVKQALLRLESSTMVT